MPINAVALLRPRLRAFVSALLCALPLAGISVRDTHGQDLIENLRKLTRDAGDAYLEPAASGLGTAMNTGWFHRPPDPVRFKLTFDFGFVVVGGLFVGSPEHFETDADFHLTREQGLRLVDSAMADLGQDPRFNQLPESQQNALRDTLLARLVGTDLTVNLRGPTAIGPRDDSLYIRFLGTSQPISVPATEAGGSSFDTSLVIRPLEASVPLSGALGDLPFLPVAAPKLTIGTFYGTQLALRYLPKVKVLEEMGRLGLFGAGLQHNLAMWLPGAPVDLTVDAHWQRLEIEDALMANTYTAGAMVSKTFGGRRLGIIPFGGLAWEKSTLEAEYSYEVDLPTGTATRKAKYTIEGKNLAHYTLGLAVQLFHVNLFGDYNFGEYDSFSGGLMILL